MTSPSRLGTITNSSPWPATYMMRCQHLGNRDGTERRRLFKWRCPVQSSSTNYNQAMGGVDLFDQSVAAYRIRIRSKKWWWSLLNWGIKAAAVNAWMLKKMVTDDDKLSLLEFVREAVTETLCRHGTPRDRPGRPLAVSGAAAAGARADERPLWPEKAETMWGRCRHC